MDRLLRGYALAYTRRYKRVGHLVTLLGLSIADPARQLGGSTSGIAKGVARIKRPQVHSVNIAFRTSGFSRRGARAPDPPRWHG